MATYVTSLRGNARLAHIGTGQATVCGYVFASAYRVTDTLPEHRNVCPICLRDAAADGRITPWDAARLHAHLPAGYAGFAPEDVTPLIDLYVEGFSDKAVATRLGLGLRTVVRRAAYGMSLVDARTRFQWGYMLGLSRGRAEARA